MQSTQSNNSPHSFLSPALLSKRQTSPESPCDVKTLKTKVAQLLTSSYSRCRSCVRKRIVHPQETDFASFLEANLLKREFESIVENPHLFVKDPKLCKSLVVEEEPSWDYLLAHDPDEITPLHLFYKKRSEDKKERIQQQRADLEKKRVIVAERRSCPDTCDPYPSKPAIRVRPAMLFEQTEKPRDDNSIPTPILILPHIGSVPLLKSKKLERAPRSQSTDKRLWNQFQETYMQAEAKYREKIAKSRESRSKRPQLPAIGNKRAGHSKKLSESLLYGENRRRRRRAGEP